MDTVYTLVTKAKTAPLLLFNYAKEDIQYQRFCPVSSAILAVWKWGLSESQ